MTQYPRDEFDKVPESTSRQGVHRERLVPPRSSGLGLIITVGLLALLVGLAAYFVLPRLGISFGDGDSSSATTASVESPPSSSSASSSSAPSGASASPSTSPSEEPSASPETSEAAESPEPTEPAAAVNKSQPVAVMNATAVPGLAGSVAQRISADGWTPGAITNWAGQPLQTSIIYYGGPEQLPNAQALSAYLGIPTVVESAAAGPLTVVLGPGYQ